MLSLVPRKRKANGQPSPPKAKRQKASTAMVVYQPPNFGARPVQPTQAPIRGLLPRRNGPKTRAEVRREKIYTTFFSSTTVPSVPVAGGWALPAGGASAYFYLNPGNPNFPRGSQEAKIWKRWRLKSDIVVEFVPEQSAFGCSGGRSVLAFNPDTSDDPTVDPIVLQDYLNLTSIPSEPLRLRIPLSEIGSQWRYVRTGPLPTGTDAKTYDAGVIMSYVWACLPTSLASTPAGDVFVEWDIEYDNPVAPVGSVFPASVVGLQNCGSLWNTQNSAAQAINTVCPLISGSGTGLAWSQIADGSPQTYKSTVDECAMVVPTQTTGVFDCPPGLYMVTARVGFVVTGGVCDFVALYYNLNGTGYTTSATPYLLASAAGTNDITANPGMINCTFPVVVPATADGSTSALSLSVQISNLAVSGTYTISGSAGNSRTNITVVRIA